LQQSFFESLKRDLEIVENSCIFTLPVTIWLMILQRLSQKGTLATAVNELVYGNGRELLEPCKKALENNISTSTGAYSQARLLIAIASYNLIRAVMAEAARTINVDPRRLSFSRSRESFYAFVRAAAHADSQEKFEYHWRLLMRTLSQSKLPKLNRPPAPRVVWPKPHGFPTRKVKNNG
jgi:hypothetical protein